MFSGIILTNGAMANVFLYMAAVGRATGTSSQLFNMLIGINPTCSVIMMYFKLMWLCCGMCM